MSCGCATASLLWTLYEQFPVCVWYTLHCAAANSSAATCGSSGQQNTARHGFRAKKTAPTIFFAGRPGFCRKTTKEPILERHKDKVKIDNVQSAVLLRINLPSNTSALPTHGACYHRSLLATLSLPTSFHTQTSLSCSFSLLVIQDSWGCVWLR